jgi:hypothetical protein
MRATAHAGFEILWWRSWCKGRFGTSMACVIGWWLGA